MDYDIYDNPLKSGYCEVHPDVPETYPCSICIYQYQTYLQERHPPPNNMKYGYNKNKFKMGINNIIKEADEKFNEIAFLLAVKNLLNLIELNFITSSLYKMMEKEREMEND
jgi:hypothetical protein